MNEFPTSTNSIGNYIEYRGYDSRGKRVHVKKKFKPTVYTTTNEESEWRSLDGKTIAPVRFNSIKDCRNFLEKYEGVHGFDIFGTTNFATQFIQNLFPGEIKFDRSLIHVCTKDIEVISEKEFPKPEDAKYSVVSITMHSSKKDEFYVIATHESQKYNPKKTELNIDPKKLFYFHAKDEEELFEIYLKLWKALDFDIITGWHIRGFDVPYLVNRIERLFGDGSSNQLSPWNRVRFKPYYVKGKEVPSFEIAGIAILDYLDLFQKFGYVYGPQENYRLDTIAYTVLEERKLDYSEYGNLTNLYYENFHKYVDYNIRDVDLVVRIDKKTDLLSLALTVAYMAGINYGDVLGTTAIWHSIIYRNLISKKMAPPIFKKDNVKQDFPGAYVKEPVPGAYDWVCSFDLNSLYPNLIVQYNMSPETFIGMKDGVSVEKYLDGKLHFEGKDYSVAPNGAMFRKDKQGIIPAIIEEYYDFRVSIQNEMDNLIHSNGDESEIKRLENVQWAIKILLNSLYGAISNAYFIYFMLQIAEAITLGGQLSIKWAEKYINNWLNEELKTKNADYVAYVDTDSLYITLKEYLNQNYKGDDIVSCLDGLCRQVIGPLVIDRAYHDLFKMTNGYKNRMVMKREAICDKALWTAKKRYILNVLDNKGKRYDEPKIKMTGIEAIKSTTPEILRDKMKESFKILLTKPENESQEFVDNFKQEFKKLSPEDISFPKTANNIKKFKDKDKLYKKGTPLQVRASLLYNKLLTDKEVGNKYQAINSGDKVRYIYLKMPNPIKENVIAFPDVLPKEFDLHEYIDYNLMFEKGFLDPLDPIFKALGYTTEETIDIESFMS